ncbi:HAD hydrolase family protein [Paenibacillus xylaniclasticus]|uniref:HAD hydrolase family protein n=1 Tax=Paenibacillus xylaniclasticus TaxID=588083 RepID=UPI000FD7FFFD|nr:MULTISPECIES: HAD hydrolase family protein [Paenibacillus]GFN30989.1 sugar/pyridoxal phosphate phosphatase YigL [Paenibacillus curdlanolyticus]
MKRYYVTDLDGTLLRSDASLSDYTVQVVNEALAEGIVISYATARSYRSSNRVTSQIHWRYPVVLYNGAMIVDPVSQQVLGGHWLDHDVTNDIVAIGRTLSLAPFLFSLDDNDQERVLHEKLSRYGDIAFHASRPGDPRFREVEKLISPPAYRTLMVTYIGLRDELEPLFHAISDRYGESAHIQFIPDGYIDKHYFLEISHPNANKEHGLALWCELVGCQREDVTVFGDNLNDIGMFKQAGRPFAVADAHPELKRMATDVIGSCNDDSVAKFIESELKGARPCS